MNKGMAIKDGQNILLSFDELCEATNGKIVFAYARMEGVCSVVIDSRDVLAGSLFVPLRGEKQDGHKYIEAALEKGAVCFLVDTQFLKDNKSAIKKLCQLYERTCIAVESNLYALQDAARYYVQKFPNIIKIAITGSSGKTTTKEILVSILSDYKETVFSEGNLNSETGLPLSVFKIRDKHRFAVFEMGMNRENEIAELAKVLNPHIAIITNIGTAHIGMLGSQEKIAEEKKKIFSQFDESCTAYIPDDAWADFLSTGVRGKIKKIDAKTFIAKNFIDLKNLGSDGFEFNYKGSKIKFKLIAEHNLVNAAMAICVAEDLGAKKENIVHGLETVKALYGRAEVVQGEKAKYLFDVYNANPQSMFSAIRFLESLKNVRRIALLGSMLELGDYAFEAHKKIIEEVLNSNIELCFLYGDEIVSVFESLDIDSKKFLLFKSNEAEALSKNLEASVCENDFVLLKGSRSLRLERFANVLGGKIK